MKIVSLSFDDGTIYDEKFIKLLEKYDIKASLNLNSGLNDFVWHLDGKPIKRLNLEESSSLYKNQEVASHSFSHPYFSSLNDEQAIEEIRKDIFSLSRIFNRKINGFAFPFSDEVDSKIELIKNTFDLKYIRYSKIKNSYIPQDRYHVHINALYNDEKIYDKLKDFASNSLDNSLFVIAGHSYEFEVNNDWNRIENLLRYLSKEKDITVLPLEDSVDILFK